jgi:predicted ribosomally synthesized peptide with nif11-like leader
MGRGGGFEVGLGGLGWAWWLWGWLGEEVLRDTEECLRMGYNICAHRTTKAMSEEQLSTLLTKLKEDAGLLEKLKGAADLDAAVAMAQEAGFDVSKADWLRYQAKETLELTDEELTGVTGGTITYFPGAEAGTC